MFEPNVIDGGDVGLFNGLKNAVEMIFDLFLFIFPDCPFTSVVENLQAGEWIKAVNWVIPIGTFLDIALVWVACMALVLIFQFTNKFKGLIS